MPVTVRPTFPSGSGQPSVRRPGPTQPGCQELLWITLDDIRRYATAFPEVEEATHFRLPTFKVNGKPFAGPEKGVTTAVFAVSQQEAAAAVADDPETYEEVWRISATTKIFVGLRVDLAGVTEERLGEMIEHAWRNKAPKRVVAAYDAR